MSTTRLDDQPAEDGPPPALANRLGYLLKHAQQSLHELTNAAMAPYGVNGRECAVLMAIDDRAPISQQEVARRLAVDRTTMVALIDELEDKGLVQRRQDPDDRRRNVVELTDHGRDSLRKATRAGDKAEAKFLGPLSDEDAESFRQALRSLVFS